MFHLDISPDTLNQLSVVLGLLLPPVVAFIVKANWKRRTKQGVAIGLAALAAVFVSVTREGIGYDSVDAFLHSVFVIIGVAQTFYVILWKTILGGVTKRLEGN